jgi:hypothetical protein
MKKLNVLILCNSPAKNTAAVTTTDHLGAFQLFSRHNIYVLSFIKQLPNNLNLGRFDVIVIHYSIPLGYLGFHYLDEKSRNRINEFNGLKAVFIQDEFRSVNDVIDALRSMDIDVLFTCVPDKEIEKVYPEERLPGLKKINNLTGYVPDRLLHQVVPPIADRPVDVGYRTRRMPYWLGELGYEKWQIAVDFMKYAVDSNLHTDISYDESDRIYGDQWTTFITSCKAVLGVESGASVFDFTGSLKDTVDEYVAEKPNADFFEVQEKFLQPYEGKIYLNQISPRCFEAAALKTAMVLFEGEYSGILIPDRHFIPLKKNFSNFSDVLNKLKNHQYLQDMVDRTYKEVAENDVYHYRSFIEMFDDTISEEMTTRRKTYTKTPYTNSKYKMDLFISPSYLFHRVVALPLQRIALGSPLRGLIYKIWNAGPLWFRQLIRPFVRIIGR